MAPRNPNKENKPQECEDGWNAPAWDDPSTMPASEINQEVEQAGENSYTLTAG